MSEEVNAVLETVLPTSWDEYSLVLSNPSTELHKPSPSLAPCLHYHEEHGHAEQLHPFFQTMSMPAHLGNLWDPHSQDIWTCLWVVCSMFDFTAHLIFTGAMLSRPSQNENVESHK